MLNRLVNQFHTAPFLFVGSGLSRRYLGLPNWEGLLQHFAERLSPDPFAYRRYYSEAETLAPPSEVLPCVATLIEAAFNLRWFSDPNFRTEGDDAIRFISEGASPFKASVADYISQFQKVLPEYEDEVTKLSTLTRRSLSGIITTNYDQLLESLTDDYATFIGQDQLIFSLIQGIAETYKIHGCISDPQSIVINAKDYANFSKKGAYLAAKLLTIFMEYPIIFLGYSISDTNIQQILRSIVECLPKDKLLELQNRFIFVEYNPTTVGVNMCPHTFAFDGKEIGMTKVSLSDFSILYEALSTVKTKVPVRIIRTFKQEFYDFSITGTPTGRLRVVDIDDEDLKGDDLALIFGRNKDLERTGLLGVSANEWFRDTILDDIRASSDDLLNIVFPKLLRSNAGLPIFKHLTHCSTPPKSCTDYAATITFDSFSNRTIRIYRAQRADQTQTIAGIASDNNTLEAKTRLMTYLREDEVDPDELFAFLYGLFSNNPEILNERPSVATNIRKLIRIYDYLKYKKEEPQPQ